MDIIDTKEYPTHTVISFCDWGLEEDSIIFDSMALMNESFFRGDIQACRSSQKRTIPKDFIDTVEKFQGMEKPMKEDLWGNIKPKETPSCNEAQVLLQNKLDQINRKYKRRKISKKKHDQLILEAYMYS